MATRPDCFHSEGRIEGRRLDTPHQHDCDYVEARQKLIPQAARIADELTAPQDGKGWDRVFHATMQRLVRERGLIA